MKIVAPFAQRAGRVDRVATIPQQREPGLADVVSHNYATDINCKLRKETRLPIVIEVRGGGRGCVAVNAERTRMVARARAPWTMGGIMTRWSPALWGR
jgi:hypothetical protein